MIIVGINPSFTATGYAIIHKKKDKQPLIKYGFLPLSAKNQMHVRVGMFYDFFEKYKY